MKPKVFLEIFLSTVMGAVCIVAAMNYHLDYYGVFHPENEIPTTGINDRFVKMKYLLTDEHFKKYDSYLLGSSRVMKTDSKLTGKKTYNLGVPSGMLEDFRNELQLLLKHKAPIQTIYWAIDDIIYLSDYSYVQSKAFGYSYRENFVNDITAYSYYLFRPSIIQHALGEIEGEHGYTLLHQTGIFVVPDFVEENIEQNPYEYVHRDWSVEKHLDTTTDQVYDKNMKTLRELINLCKQNHIQLVIYFNPIKMQAYMNSDLTLMTRFKKELARLSPFWDFSGVNYVTANNYFWYDGSHPRAFICDKILDTVSGQNKITWVPDFGVYVTSENVDAFCEKAVRDRGAYDPNHEQWIPSSEERKIMTKRMNY